MQKKIEQKSSKLKLLLLMIVTFTFFYVAFDAFVKVQKQLTALADKKTIAPVPVSTPKIKPPVKKPKSRYSRGIISLTADAYGHFRGQVIINGISMPFLIDTGATKTVIPEKLATEAKLPIGKKVITNTAGGQVFAYQTTIDTLNIQGVQIKQLNAQINAHLHEVLIGMNTLKYFNMSLNGTHLTLVSNSHNTIEATAKVTQPVIKNKPKKSSVIIKRKVCDANNKCRTVFSDY